MSRVVEIEIVKSCSDYEEYSEYYQEEDDDLDDSDYEANE